MLSRVTRKTPPLAEGCQVAGSTATFGCGAVLRTCSRTARRHTTKQGGTVSEVEGPFGLEVSATVPVQSGSSFSSRKVRFVGIDGPRWFLRAVIGGPAATSSEAAEIIHTMIRRVVVVRGSTPLPPRDLLPLRVPPTGETPVTGGA